MDYEGLQSAVLTTENTTRGSVRQSPSLFSPFLPALGNLVEGGAVASIHASSLV